MKAYEFSMKITSEGKVIIPEALIKTLPKDEELRCIALVKESQDKKFQTALSDIKQQEFSYHFPPEDAVYDDF